MSAIDGKLKEIVKGDNRVHFTFYRNRALHYTTDDGFVFPVPVDQAGSATFNASERAMLLMRYIRAQLEMIERERVQQSTTITIEER